MKVSIIIPVYNTSEYLPLLFNSLDGQTYKDIEIIFIDDASTDNSYKICEDYCLKDINNRKIIHKKINEGLNPARHSGLINSSGELIAFVDSDDWFENDYIECLVSCIEKGADIGCLPIIKEKKDGTIVEIIGKINYDYVIWDKETALLKLFEGKEVRSFMHNKIFRKEILNDTDFTYNRPFEDIISTAMAFANAKKVHVLNKPRYHYVMRGNSLSTKSKQSYLSAIDAMIIRKQFYLSRFNDANVIKYADFEIFDWFIEVASTYLVTKKEEHYHIIRKLYRDNKKSLPSKRVINNIPIYLFSPRLFLLFKKLKRKLLCSS